jgi:hypothetical protein
MDDELTGTWFSPAGPKIEITAVEDGWRYAVFMFRKGSSTGERVMTDADEVREHISRIESEGYVKSVPGEEPPRTSLTSSQIAGLVLVGFGVVLVVILVVVLT